MHPHHLDLLKQSATADDPAGRVRLRGDENFRPGDVRVETERGLIDASLDTQLARLEEALLTDAAARDSERGTSDET